MGCIRFTIIDQNEWSGLRFISARLALVPRGVWRDEILGLKHNTRTVTLGRFQLKTVFRLTVIRLGHERFDVDVEQGHALDVGGS